MGVDGKPLSRSAQAKKLADAVEESRKKQLKQVQKELESGNYRVSAKDIARKLIDSNTK